MEEHCDLTDAFFFKVEYQLVTPMGSGYMPYPVLVHPGLFPPSIFRIPHTGLAEYVKTEKEMCCDGQVFPCPITIVNNVASSRSSNTADFTFSDFASSTEHAIAEKEIAIFPNPTST